MAKKTAKKSAVKKSLPAKEVVKETVLPKAVIEKKPVPILNSGKCSICNKVVPRGTLRLQNGGISVCKDCY